MGTLVKYRVHVTENAAKHCKHAAYSSCIKEAHNELTNQSAHCTLQKVHSQYSCETCGTISAVEVGQPRIVAAILTHILSKNQIGNHDCAVHTAKDIADGGNHDQTDRNHPSFSPFWRITMRIGVPSKPNTARIWFSKYLW